MQVCTAQQVQGLAYSEQDKHTYALIVLTIPNERSLICIVKIEEMVWPKSKA